MTGRAPTVRSKTYALRALPFGLAGGDGTPTEKRIWVNYDSDNQMVSALSEALKALGLLAPSFVAPGEVMRLYHNSEHSLVGIRFEPREPPPLDRV